MKSSDAEREQNGGRGWQSALYVAFVRPTRKMIINTVLIRH